MHMRVGIGWDIHRVTTERPLFLGGVNIPGAPGLLGHSDGDVLVHAVTDALLGAAGLGDIGEHFPDTDPSLAGISGESIASRVTGMLAEKGLRIINIDCTVVAEKPRLDSHKPAIKSSLSRIFGVQLGLVNVKAKSMEHLGPVGEGEAIEAFAAVLITQAVSGP